MGMKPIRAAALVVLATGLVWAQPPAGKEAQIDQLLSAMNADSTINQIFEQVKAMTASQLPAGATPEQAARAQEIQSRILDLVKSRIGWEKMRPQYVKMYSETFSEEEISAMLAFYQSPAGRAMLQKMPMIIRKSMEIAQTQMEDLLPEIQRIVRDGLSK